MNEDIITPEQLQIQRWRAAVQANRDEVLSLRARLEALALITETSAVEFVERNKGTPQEQVAAAIGDYGKTLARQIREALKP